MPVASKIQELIDALKTRETNITRALDDLFGSENALDRYRPLGGDHPIRATNALEPNPGADLPKWAKDELTNPARVQKPLLADEIAHLRKWPRDQKDAVRNAIVNALDGRVAMKFYWEFHIGQKEDTDISNFPVVIFRSPQRNLGFSGATFAVRAKVKVGP